MFDLEWVVRDNEEIDEKLPMMAKDVIQRGIDYNQLDRDEEPDFDVINALVEVLSDNLHSFNHMTYEEIVHAIPQLWLAAVLVECVEQGALETVRCKELF